MILESPIGFGTADYLELALGILALAALAFYRLRKAKAVWWFAALAILPALLRFGLLPVAPVPIGSGVDDFAHLLAGDTLTHFRFANPVHPMHRFFETNYVMQEPAYVSIYPVGQGIALALGKAVFGHPWAGVLLSVSAFCALCYWMLRGWTTPQWALAGGLIAVCEFGPLRYWTNTYWGGAVSATAGCLVFGALPRLKQNGRWRHAVLLGVGFGIQMLTRPFEAVILGICVGFYLFHSAGWRNIAIAALATLPACGIMLIHNYQATGSFSTLPYQVSRYQYGIPATFTTEPNPVPHRFLTQAQQLDYDAQSAVHGTGVETVATYFNRLFSRFRFARFFFLPPLYLALPFFLPSLRQRRFLWVTGTVVLFALGTNFYPYFYPHYIAALTCLFVLIPVVALQRMNPHAARILVVLTFAHFIFWYCAHLVNATGTIAYETWDFVNHGDPEGRTAVNSSLAAAPGYQLVFVHYSPSHRFAEWVQNAADIDRSRVVWALDLGAEENRKLLAYYPRRTPWLIEPDAHPPRLSAYTSPAPPEPVPFAPAPRKPMLQFEPVR